MLVNPDIFPNKVVVTKTQCYLQLIDSWSVSVRVSKVRGWVVQPPGTESLDSTAETAPCIR